MSPNLPIVITILLAAVGASAALAQSSSAPAPPAPAHTIALGLLGYSPVSYLDDSRAEPGSPRFSAEHQGVIYFFTSADQRATFERSPERYLPAFGGYCAFGCSVDSLFVPDPHSFEIINGRTHLFLKNEDVDARQLWNDADRAEVRRKASAFWRTQTDAE